MAITSPQGIDLQAPEALELKTIQLTLTARDAISLVTRYDGLKVYVVSEQKNYQLRGGITNAFWTLVGDTIDYSNYYSKIDLQTAGQSQVNWFNLTDVPSSFPPSVHTHHEVDIVDLQPYLLNISGSSIDELADVLITTPSNNDILQFIGGYWVNNALSIAWGNITGLLSDQFDLQTILNNKKNNFTENTAFNKNFGTGNGDVANGDHTHLDATTIAAGFMSITDKIKLDSINPLDILHVDQTIPQTIVNGIPLLYSGRNITTDYQLVDKKFVMDNINSGFRTIRVSNETELISAFTMLNSVGGGNIFLLGDITLTANRILDHTNIVVSGNKTINFNNYYINVNSGAANYNDVYFNGTSNITNNVSNIFKYSNVIGTLPFHIFYNCQFFNVVGVDYTTVGVLDFSTSAGGGQVVLDTCINAHPSSIDTKFFSIKHGNTYDTYLHVHVINYLAGVSATGDICNIFGIITPVTSGATYYSYDNSNKYASSGAISLDIDHLVNSNGTRFIDEKLSIADTDYLTITDVADRNIRKKVLKSNAGFLTSFTETDPIFLASQAHNITSGHITILGNTSGTNSGDNAINSLYSGLVTSKVDANTTITGATKTKITYDSKGLITSGIDATTADIADSLNKRYQTDNQQSFNDATSSIQTQINSKQATLVSTTNIKTVGGVSLLGSGDNSAFINDLTIGDNTTGHNLSIFATLGPELAPAFTGNSGVNWTFSNTTGYTNPLVGTIEKTGDGTGTFTPTAVTNIIANKKYKVTYVVTSISGGTIGVTFGGSIGVSISATGTIVEYIYTSSTVKPVFTPSATGTRFVLTISWKLITDGTGDETIEGDLVVNTIKAIGGIDAIIIKKSGSIIFGLDITSRDIIAIRNVLGQSLSASLVVEAPAYTTPSSTSVIIKTRDNVNTNIIFNSVFNSGLPATESGRFLSNGNFGLGGIVTPSSWLELGAGATTKAPLKLNSGALATGGALLAGNIEFLTDTYYATITTGLARRTFAFLESPIFITPTLGVASATSINKVTITQPTTSATLTLIDGSSLVTAGGAYSITLTASAATNVTLPTTGTLATLAGVESFTNKTINNVNNYVDADALHQKVFLNLGSSSTIGMPVQDTVWNIANSCTEISKCSKTSATPCLGLMETVSTDGTVGEVRTSGILNNVNTNSWSEGSILYVDTAGNLTTTKPAGTSEFIKRVGVVIRQHATLGVIDVVIGSVVDNSVLRGVNTGDLVSGTTIKTINGNSLLGSGDLSISGGAGTLYSGTSILNFTNESDSVILTVTSASINNTNIKSFSYICTDTTETSLDDFTLNGVTFNIENIIDNTSFDIRGSSINGASGNYTIKYLITT